MYEPMNINAKIVKKGLALKCTDVFSWVLYLYSLLLDVPSFFLFLSPFLVCSAPGGRNKFWVRKVFKGGRQVFCALQVWFCRGLSRIFSSGADLIILAWFSRGQIYFSWGTESCQKGAKNFSPPSKKFLSLGHKILEGGGVGIEYFVKTNSNFIKGMCRRGICPFPYFTHMGHMPLTPHSSTRLW